MMKVILVTAAGRQVDLMPERFRMRDVFGRFHADAESAYTVNGAILEEEDLDRCLREFSEDDEVRIMPCPERPGEADGFPEGSVIRVGDSKAEIVEIYEALQKAKQAIDEAVKALGIRVVETEELPF